MEVAVAGATAGVAGAAAAGVMLEGGWREEGEEVTLVKNKAGEWRLALDGEFHAAMRPRRATIVGCALEERKHKIKGKHLRLKNGKFDRCAKLEDVTLEKIFHVLDRNRDGWVDFNEVLHCFSLWTDSAKDADRLSGPKGAASFRPKHHPSTWRNDACKTPMQRKSTYVNTGAREATAGEGD